MEDINTAAEILLNFEKDNPAFAYTVKEGAYKKHGKIIKPAPVKYATQGEDIFVVSDLHIASGRNDAGVYSGTENFFADDSFRRFTLYADKVKKSQKAILLINGDVFDFLRITDFPGKPPGQNSSIKRFLRSVKLYSPQKISDDKGIDEFNEWSGELKKIGITKTPAELENSIYGKEKIFGLKTDNYKTVYKLMKIKHGHPVFFKALKEWTEKGNKLVLVKGNHDLEIYWPEVRNYLRLIIAEEIAGREKDIEEVLKEIVLPNIFFIDDSIEIDEKVYIEHGHRYDKFSLVLGGAVLDKNPLQLNIPFGSFFNRYLLNRVELFYPFLDNVRPSKNILPILIKENFPLALKVLFMHIPLLLRILTTNFRYLKFMLNRVFWLTISIFLPVILIFIIDPALLQKIISQINSINNVQGVLSLIINEAKNLGLLILPYFLARLTAWLQLEEPSSLHNFAELIAENGKYEIITMGHTHNPGEYLFNGTCRFYNTGTWIPVIESSTADIREDRTYTFLHIINYGKGILKPAENGLLQRWNDDAGRAEPLNLIRRK